MGSFQLDEQTLTEYGFKRINEESFIINPFRHSPQQQWEYKDTILSLSTVNGNMEPVFFNKQTPQFSLKFNGERQLKEILWHIDQGKTIVDLLLAIQKQRAKDVKRMEEQQKNKPFLEDFRYNDIGGSFFKIKAYPEQKIFRPYEKHATSAFHYTLNDIVILENANDTLQTSTQSHPAISFWFLAIESYINTLIKLCCLKKSADFNVFKRQDLHTRMNSLIKLLELNIKLVNQNKIITKINEFARFRNELFHDRHFGEEIIFRYTQFSGIPIFCCQVDVFQSILILLEIASLLRFAIAGLDTMPTVILHNKDVAVWEKLDVAYEKILYPYFTAVLEKHSIRTRLELEFKPTESLKSGIFQKGEILCEIRADQEPEYDVFLNQRHTNLGVTFYNDYLSSLNYKPGTLRIAQVMLD